VIDGSPVTVAVRSRLVVNTAEAAVDAATMSLGVTRVLSYQAADALHAGRLALALEAFEPAPWPVSLVYTGQGLLPRIWPASCARFQITRVNMQANRFNAQR
jgi:DNA-binding transcriptional LysR family regulator